MSIAAYSTCRIQFIPSDGQRSERDYSDRSLIELRQYDFADYSLRALDIEHNKQEIFNIPFKKEAQYKRGQSTNHPDEIRSSNGSYRLWLNAASRTNFHEALTTCIEQLSCLSSESPPPQSPTTPSATRPQENSRLTNDSQHSDERRHSDEQRRDNYSGHSDDQQRKNHSQHSDDRRPSDDQHHKNHSRHSDGQRLNNDSRHSDEQRYTDDRSSHAKSQPTAQPNRNDILVDVHELGCLIRQGETDEAVNLTKKLAEQRVQLEATPYTQQNEEKEIKIRVKIDSNDHEISNRNTEIEMSVYPSTTVRELRTAFGYSVKNPSINQYLFVNGHLAHENSTMTELNVRRNSLFVLFIIQQ